MLLGVDGVIVNVKATKINFLTSPSAFCMSRLETMFCRQSKHFSDMYDVFRQGIAVNHIIIMLYDDEFAFHWF